jgi:hypothetical protein
MEINMAIQRMSDQHKIRFLDAQPKDDPKQAEQTIARKTIEQVQEEQKAKKLNNKDNGLMTNHTIFSARTGEISDEGGPSKYVKSESSNTLWDSDKTARLAKEIDSKTRVQKEKETIATNKRVAEQKRVDEMVEKLRTTDQSKASSVSPMNSYSGSSYNVPKGAISMFDTKDFQRLAEASEGEALSTRVQEERSKTDDSWKSNGKQVSSKDIINNFFENLTKSNDKQESI